MADDQVIAIAKEVTARLAAMLPDLVAAAVERAIAGNPALAKGAGALNSMLTCCLPPPAAAPASVPDKSAARV